MGILLNSLQALFIPYNLPLVEIYILLTYWELTICLSSSLESHSAALPIAYMIDNTVLILVSWAFLLCVSGVLCLTTFNACTSLPFYGT